LTEVAVPLTVGGRHYATFLVGQVFCQKPDARNWARLTSLMGEDGDKNRLARLRRAYLAGHVLPDELLKPFVHIVALHVCRVANDLRQQAAAQRSKQRQQLKTAPRPRSSKSKRSIKDQM
jgi:hypothetical protein